MENENTFFLRTGDRRGFDVEIWAHEGQVWFTLDPNTTNQDEATQPLTAEQARAVAAALIRFADKV